MVALMVILTMLGFIVVDGFVQHAQAKRLADRPVEMHERAPVAPVDLTTPGGFFLSPQHIWLQIRENGKVRVGVDALVSGLLGRVTGVMLPGRGSLIKAGQPVFSVQAGSRRLDLVAPVAGIVRAVNEQAADQPAGAFSKPYANWICELDAVDLVNEVNSLRIGDQAMDWLRAEAERVGEFLMRRSALGSDLGLALADGGTPRSGALETLDPAAWEEFQRQFLAPTN